jgi:eukaryotic-like serine/threonine-protein kinase
MKKYWLRSLSTCFLLGIAFLFSACQSQQTTGTIPTIANPSTHITPQTNCPATGKARALDVIPLAHGTQPTIVYDYNPETGSATIKSYNVATNQKSTIYTALAGVNITNAQVSNDGQWIVFLAWKTAGTLKLQVIRVDGQDLQTLYCTDSSQGLDNIQWSPDQAHIAFTTEHNGLQMDTLYLLNTTNGNLQTETALSQAYKGYPITWLDATHLYTSGPSFQGAHPGALYLFDINQNPHQLQTVWSNPSKLSWYASLSPNGKRLYISQTEINNSNHKVTIYSLSPTGQGAQAIYHDQIQGSIGTTVCVATNNTLLVRVFYNTSTPANNNGFYKMNTNGTGLTKIFPLQVTSNLINIGCTTSSENVSRDGSMYAFSNLVINNNEWLYYGKLSGGQPMTFASTGNSGSVDIIGWTTL